MSDDTEPGRWLRAFPRPWRAHYGRELDALVDELREEGDLRPSDRIDILRSGLTVRRRAVKPRALYGALGAVVTAVCVLVALALAGTFGPTQRASGPPAVIRIRLAHPHVVRITGPLTLCQVNGVKRSTGTVYVCRTVSLRRVHQESSGIGSVTITVR